MIARYSAPTDTCDAETAIFRENYANVIARDAFVFELSW